jgi:uncharacterized protein with NRDE domain
VCSIVLAHLRFAGVPVLVAANRDERLGRASSGPRIWAGDSPQERFLAPRDEVAGGTWLGLTRAGLFVGVTNRFAAPKDDARASRGALVLDALRAADALALRASLEQLPAERYNAFHLVYADARDAFVTWSDGARVSHTRLDPGVHVVTERSFRATGAPNPLPFFGIPAGDDHAREARLRGGLEACSPEGVAAPPTPGFLAKLLGIHDDPAASDPFGATCIHVPALDYGTRSSMLAYVAADLASSRLYWAEGAPCTAPFVEQRELTRALFEG